MFLVISKVDVLFTNTTYSSTEMYDHIYKTIGSENGRLYWTYLQYVLKCNYWYQLGSPLSMYPRLKPI